MTETKRKYRVPSVSADVDVRLDQFDDQEIIEYLRHQGHTVDGLSIDAPKEALHYQNFETLVISVSELNRINTLALCGQREAARVTALEIISEAIGRPL